MDLRIGDRCALITGAGGDIGKGIAEAFVREGATVILHGQSRAQLDPIVTSLRGNVHAVVGDLASDEDSAPNRRGSS